MATAEEILQSLTVDRPPVPDCPRLEILGNDLCIRFPGGATMCVQMPRVSSVNGYEQCKQLLAQVNAGAMGLDPMFKTLDAILCLKDVLEAVPDAITTLDVTAISDALVECAKKVEKLLGLLPPLSVPLLVCDILSLIIACLNGIIDELQRILNDQARAASSALVRDSMDDDDPAKDALSQIIACAESVFADRQRGLGQGVDPLNLLIDTVNALGSLVGLPEIPTIASIAGETGEEIERLRLVVGVLESLKAQIQI